MTAPADGSLRFAVLAGSGGRIPNLDRLAATPAESARFATLVYPGWRRYVQDDFSAPALVRELADAIAGWGGRVAILGFSLGGHLGYAVALELQRRGVEVVGLCAVDSFMISSAAIRPGWAARHLARLRGIARSGSAPQLWRHARSLFWRSLARLMGGRAQPLLRRGRESRMFREVFAAAPTLEDEINMRLLMRATAPWLGEIDREPVPLRGNAVLLRTATAAGSDAAWRARCPDVEIVEIPGDHDSLFDPEYFPALQSAFARATRRWG